MTLRRSLLAIFLLAGLIAAGIAATSPGATRAVAGRLPEQLTDEEFWRLSSTMSEAGGTFHSDNFVSNEAGYQVVIPDLVATARQGGVYIGVGPEQNFTYIAALRPAMAFIVDIRRGNLQEHLLYKALFEMSANRAEFLSRLFSRPRLERVAPDATPEQLFAALHFAEPGEALYQENLGDVTAWLTVHHGFPLEAADIQGIDYVYRNGFFLSGPDLNYRRTDGNMFRGGSGMPTYAQLMAIDDGRGTQRSFLATEENFQAVKMLHARNLVVPVVGDFGGGQALRGVGRYVRERGALVAALYASNVEQYLRQDGKWNAFCANVASMPIDATSTFIRSARARFRGGFGAFRFESLLGNMVTETARCGGRRQP